MPTINNSRRISVDERSLPWAFLVEALPDCVDEYWTPRGPTDRCFDELEQGFRLSQTEEAIVRVALDFFNGDGKASMRLVLHSFSDRPRKALIRFLQALDTTASQRTYLQQVL